VDAIRACSLRGHCGSRICGRFQAGLSLKAYGCSIGLSSWSPCHTPSDRDVAAVEVAATSSPMPRRNRTMQTGTTFRHVRCMNRSRKSPPPNEPRSALSMTGWATLFGLASAVQPSRWSRPACHVPRPSTRPRQFFGQHPAFPASTTTSTITRRMPGETRCRGRLATVRRHRDSQQGFDSSSRQISGGSDRDSRETRPAQVARHRLRRWPSVQTSP